MKEQFHEDDLIISACRLENNYLFIVRSDVSNYHKLNWRLGEYTVTQSS